MQFNDVVKWQIRNIADLMTSYELMKPSHIAEQETYSTNDML